MHLRISHGVDGVTVRGIGRSRVDGDVWDGAIVGADPERFRVRVMDGAVERRVFEVGGAQALYPAADVAADFPGGFGADAVVAIAQWGARFGWGVEAVVKLAVPLPREGRGRIF